MLNKDYKKYIVKGVFVFLIFYLGVYFQLIPIKLFNLDLNKISKTTKVILSTFSSFMICLVLVIIYFKDLKKDFIKFKNNFLENIDIGFKWWLIGLIIMVISNLILTFVLKFGGANNQKAVQSMIKVLPIAMFISAGILAPISEEIVFRKSLRDIIDDKLFFVIVSFLFFGGAHVVESAATFTDYLYIIPYGALGGALAMAYYESDTIFTSITLHAFHNIILIILSVIAL